MKSPFLEEENQFFKSVKVTEEGSLIKAIPTVSQVTRKVEQQKKQLPKGFDKFKKKIEDSFKCIEDVVNDLVKRKGVENCIEMFDQWTKFKREFQGKINNAIHHPEYDNELKDESEPDEAKIQITKK